MRVDIARALCLDKPLIVFDEFTSVVDREIAKVSAFAISKAVRRSEKKLGKENNKMNNDIRGSLSRKRLTVSLQYVQPGEHQKPQRSPQISVSAHEKEKGS